MEKANEEWSLSLVIPRRYKTKPAAGRFRTTKKVFCLTQTLAEPSIHYLKVQLVFDQKANEEPSPGLYFLLPWLRHLACYSHPVITRSSSLSAISKQGTSSLEQVEDCERTHRNLPLFWYVPKPASFLPSFLSTLSFFCANDQPEWQ